MKLTVVAPTYNESENVERLVRALQATLDGIDYEILISDDDSPDLTWARVEEIARRDPRVRVLRRTRNRGLGNAVTDGFVAATGDVVACIDADLQHDPAILPDMLASLQNGSDLVVGSRYIAGGGTANWSWIRRLQSRLATKLAHWLLGVKLQDPMSGYFMMRREDFLHVRNQLDGEGFKILLEIVAQLKPRNLRELPYTFRPRTAGKSKVSAGIAAAYLRQLWHLSFLQKYLPTEFVKFALVGGSGVVVNLATMAVIFRLSAWRDWRASALASLIPTVNNYILNNFWTFRDRSHGGITLLNRYLHYLLISLVGLGITTLSYVGLTRAVHRVMGAAGGDVMLQDVTLLLCQFAAILVGTFSNYALNRHITWPPPKRLSAPASLPETRARANGDRRRTLP
jgi:dolichol-phosphate mannosyltransferase